MGRDPNVSSTSDCREYGVVSSLSGSSAVMSGLTHVAGALPSMVRSNDLYPIGVYAAQFQSIFFWEMFLGEYLSELLRWPTPPHCQYTRRAVLLYSVFGNHGLCTQSPLLTGCLSTKLRFEL
jgi:hypothetical protein